MLYADQLVRSFGSVDVLKGATFNVSEGERAGLVGPNGAGKSTLLRLIAEKTSPTRARAGTGAGRSAT